jgi:hypothetical protein
MTPAARSLSAGLALVAVAAGAALLTSGSPRPSPRLPEGSATAPRPAPPVAPPTAREILARASALALTAGQRRELEALDRRWQTREQALAAAAEDGQRELSAFMTEAGAGRSVPLRDIRERAAAFSERSAELREERARHAEAALGLLTTSQARQLLDMHTTPTRPGGTNEARND